jgi:ABC-2 type transport system permease protein
MKKELNFAIYAIKKNIQSSAELRTSFWMNVFGMMINNIAFLILWVFLIQKVGSIGGWSQADIFGLEGFGALVFGMVYSVGAGLREMPRLVAGGRFDQFLISPKNLLTRIATSSFDASAVGDVLFGIICIVIYLIMISASILQIGMTLLLILISLLVFIGVTTIIQSLNFFFTDPEPVTRSIFELFLTPSLFHGGAFQGTTRFIFTFLMPSLLIGTLPVEAITQISFSKLILGFVLSVFWFTFSLWFFRKAVRKYESANFMTFGS